MHTGSENKGAIVYLITLGIVTAIVVLIIFKVTGISDALDSALSFMDDMSEYMEMFN